MNILILSNIFPDPTTGYGLRIYNFIKFLHLNFNHQITLFAVDDIKSSDAYLSHLRKYSNHIEIFRTPISTGFTIFSPKIPFILKNMISIQNLSKDRIFFNRFYIPHFVNTLKQTISANIFDIAFAYSIEMSFYLSNIGIPTLVDLVDAHFDEHYGLYKVETNLVTKQMRWLMYYLLKKWTQSLPNRNLNNLIITTSREAEVISSIIPMCRPNVVSNGVDTDYFNPGNSAEDFPSIVFVGSMSPNNNNTLAVRHFYKEIYPKIRKEISNISFYVVGRNPPDDIKNIASSDKSVIVTGAVHDVRPYLDRASVVVSPMISGTGIKNKILEAMAMGKPVVCTANSVFGINVKPYENIVIADTNEDFATEILKLLRNAQVRHQIGEKARETVVQQYSWAQVVGILNSCLEQIVNKG